AVEDDPVVEALAGQLVEVGDGLRRVLVEQLDLDRALRGVHLGFAHGGGAYLRADSIRRPSEAPTRSTTRSASFSGTSTSANRSRTRTLRTASPSRPLATVMAWMMSEGSSPAARPPATISLRTGPSPSAETCGFEWRRGGAVIGVGATCASLTQGASLTPAWRSMASISRR